MHAWLSVKSFVLGQALPPRFTRGIVRNLVFLPLPHVVLHFVQLDQDDTAQLSSKKIIKCSNRLIVIARIISNNQENTYGVE